ncbi:unnamed protein product [Pieris macdunnoughi]|uniref:Uncharacterized protein n=1 Tax=Pieris macdunnoughi TaxID=345717 RepID=A0A821RW31_9NEOP|nr:unnamed protein product [Pieris macdunnoughi]
MRTTPGRNINQETALEQTSKVRISICVNLFDLPDYEKIERNKGKLCIKCFKERSKNTNKKNTNKACWLKWRWTGHIVRVKDNRCSEQVLYWHMRDGTRVQASTLIRQPGAAGLRHMDPASLRKGT